MPIEDLDFVRTARERERLDRLARARWWHRAVVPAIVCAGLSIIALTARADGPRYAGLLGAGPRVVWVPAGWPFVMYPYLLRSGAIEITTEGRKR